MDHLETDVLVIGEGAAGQTAALAASETGCRVALLRNNQASSTAISTGFLTYAAHDSFPAPQVYDTMLNTTGKGLSDRALLRRLVDDAPAAIAEVMRRYQLPVDPTERGVRLSRASGRTGTDLLGRDYAQDRATAEDMTGLMMAVAATHGTTLFAGLRTAIDESPIERIEGEALAIDPQGPTVTVRMQDAITFIDAGAVIVATGGLQGLYEFTDTPRNLLGDGQAMLLEAGADLVDMEFIQFYPLSVYEDGVPPIFLYPDYPPAARLINDREENVIEKRIGTARSLGDLHSWDLLSAAIEQERVEGQNVYVDFSAATTDDWAPDSLTATFLSRYLPEYQTRPVRIAPSSHYTIGGIRTDVNGQTSLPHIYACGEAAGGLHGANRHGGSSLVEGITFGRICGRHAADNRRHGRDAAAGRHVMPTETHDGAPADPDGMLARLRRVNQTSLGPLRDAEGLRHAADELARLEAECERWGWRGYTAFARVQRIRRAIKLSQLIQRVMLDRTETRGTHTRLDYPESDPAWLTKQVIAMKDGAFDIRRYPVEKCTLRWVDTC